MNANKGALYMKRQAIFIMVIVFGIPFTQDQAVSSGKTLASTIEVYVFPKSGQPTAQQSQDEASCYEWAASSVGQDPFDLSKQAAQQQAETDQAKAAAQQTGQGSGGRGALRGAAAGAVIGKIANDNAGKGAAVGAATGAIVGRRRGRMAQQEAVQQTEQHGQARQQATQHQVDNFKKAFGVCLEAKDYLVKY
jgi:hypothetical protein